MRIDPMASRSGSSVRAALVLLALTVAAAQAQSVPVPQKKPGAVGEVEGGEGLAGSCLRDLEAIGVVAAPAPSAVLSGECAVEDAVAVEAVDTRAGRVALPARPVLGCRFAAVLGAWLSEIVSPVAASLLGSPVETIATGPGYQCRSRAGGRLSEHAIGKALDISSVRLVDGRSVSVGTLLSAEGAEREFLRAISASACGYFTTVLGPGSDAAHSDHLHVDLADRRTAEYRICMTR